MYVLDLFVEVPSGAAAPIKYKPVEVDAINQVADGREQRKTNFVKDTSKRAETVRPQFGGHCESPSECDSAVSVDSDGNDNELNGETDDEDIEDGVMEFDDGSAQLRKIRDQGQPTANVHQEHMTTHRPHRSWCQFCVMAPGVNSPHRRSDAQDDLEGVPHVSIDCGFFGEGICRTSHSGAVHP